MNFTFLRRALAVRQALAGCAAAMPTTRQLELLTSYVLGQLSRREANHQLKLDGPALHLSRPCQMPPNSLSFS